ncbi:MAG: hypothetical protein M1829_006208 [Trizodia sp. TS-e1964]|nr:MAG: hypothetical protein M1829_006208 [Trizodia sp. TS-e1964]
MSALEQLPVEILEPIFLQSMNCNLPLASKSLLATLSNASLQFDMLVTVLYSKSTPAQSALIRRRFFDDPLYQRAADYIFKKHFASCPFPHAVT